GSDKYEIVTLHNSFHGRTLATLTATGQKKYQVGYDPLPEGFDYVTLNDSTELRAKVSNRTAAVMIEPVQGEGGVFPATEEFLQTARELCDEYGAVLIFDEVQVGLGRTGKLFGHEWFGITPDIMTLAKALAGGVPIGAMLATDKVASSFKPGDHASTFGGNPLATAVGCTVLDILLAEGFLETVQERSNELRSGLDQLAEKYGLEDRVRGLGLILGLPVTKLGPEIVEACRSKGLLINFVGGKALRFLPPLTTSTEEINIALGILDEAFEELWK
ncbi:MAG: aminotransferase class III-fold pyridoxal phosphate-dependent enzyme, partial [Desulfitobacterium hafniense]|nr:aminotransferase class III-fold pyridoxal phosphate-dependent enzyme [Desulfitobacterium hafniense]